MCPPGQFGVDCSAKDNICDLNQPCLNSGSCLLNTSHARGYDCKCQGGFGGINCEDDQRPCQPFTCFQQGLFLLFSKSNQFFFRFYLGNCTITSNTNYRCDCYPGYEGDHCERSVDICANVTCQNRGVCFSQFPSYTCNCLPGYYGRHCEDAETSGVVRGYVRKSN